MATTPTPSLVYDADRLSLIASEQTYRQGLDYFRDNRVIECYLEDDTLFALVEGRSQELPYALELNEEAGGALAVSCDCGAGGVCKHAVAALLKQADQVATQVDGAATAMETAIRDRIKRGQTEVEVTHLSGHPLFGVWQARSVGGDGPWSRCYEVHIRSLHERINFCTCPDRANNQLGTCKHIEAVLYRIGKEQPDADVQAPIPFIYLDVQDDEAIRLQRTAAMPEVLATLLDRHFDAAGRFTGMLPEDFFRLCDQLYGNDGIQIGVDARQGVERLASRQAQQWRAQRIRRRILESDGRLPGVHVRLYPYQLEGVAFLAANGRALLADDMGLGKTLQAIAAANWLIEHGGVRRVLILCPASLKHQWAREIEKFSGQSVQLVQGNAEQRQAQYRQDKTFFVLNYELALRDLSLLNEGLHPDLLILDEAQRIKNWRTRIAMAVKQIDTRYAFVLTGTPLENRLEDLYSLMQVVDQHLLGPLWRYLNDYHILDDKGKVQGYRNLSRLRQRVAPVMLRRNRSIVNDQLPPRINTRLDVPLTPRQQELHDAALANAGQLAQIARKRPLTPSEQNRMMAALQQARMACNAAGLVDKTTEGSPKLKELKTLVQELCLEGGQKMVVFSQWREMTLMIERMLQRLGVGCVHLNGQVPTARRGELMERFANDDAVSVFISTDAGGSGLNLQAATVLVNMDVPWNPAVLEQRNARIHRLGQRSRVQIILMVAADAYEERVLQLVNSKQLLFDNVVDPEASEEVVGVSARSIAALIDDLNPPAGAVGDAVAPVPETAGSGPEPDEAPEAPAVSASPDATAATDLLHDEHLRLGIATAQQRFGDRLQSVQASGGGLLLVLDALNEQDDAWAEGLVLPVPVAVIDIRTRRQLQRLGLDPLVPAPEPARPWQQLAEEKLSAARLLLQQGHPGAVPDLLCAALGAWAADRAQLDAAIAPEDLAVWLYSQALPQGLVDERQAGAIAPLLGLRLATRVPDELLERILLDIEGLMTTATAT